MAHTLPHDASSGCAATIAVSASVMQARSKRRHFRKWLFMLSTAALLFAQSASAQRKIERFDRKDYREAAREKERERERERERKKVDARGGTRTVFGQSTRSTGREVAKGEQNFAALAEYQRLHPPTVARQKTENEEEEEKNLYPLLPLDPAQTKSRRHMSAMAPAGYTPSPSMPASSSPSSTFQAAGDNNTSIPPDTHGAVDGTYAVTAVNGTFKIQTKSGGAVSSVTLDAFWAPVLSGGGSFDPRVHYDPYTSRWYIVAVSGSWNANSSVLLAISQTSNPTGSWYMYKIDADATNTNWCDYPVVGFNGKWITVSGNMFGITSGSFAHSKIWVFNKTTAMAGSSAPYTLLTVNDYSTFCPATTHSSSLSSLFLVTHHNMSLGAVRLWKITGNVGSESIAFVAYSQDASLPWWYTNNTVSGGAGIDFAPQLGSTNKIQNNDHRINQMIYMNGKLWFAHTVFLPYNASANPTRSAVQYWQIDTTGTPIQVGRIDDATNTNFYAFPTIAVNQNNDALIGFSAFSSSTRPSAAYAIRYSTDPIDSFRTPYIYRAGQNTYYKTYGGDENRWGDYSAACLDPTDNTTFWTLQEASGSTVNTWDTWWAKVAGATCSVPAITGTGTVCVSSTTTLANSTSGGTWSSSNTAVATIGSSTGVVTGVAAGTATVTYTVSSCTVTTVVTVNALPGTITGTATVCPGTTTTLASTTSGGTWSSANPSIATVNSTGVVTGVSGGTGTLISYTLSTGCRVTRNVVVNTNPASISGTASLCVSNTTTLSNSTSGGTWTSSNTAVAAIGSSTGVVTGTSAGTATISYTLSTGCRSTIVVTVSSNPGSITGTTTACVGSSTTLANATSGGTWSSSNTAVATVASSTGIVGGVSAGTATITYLLSSGCRATTVVTVTSPGSITGTATLCAGATSTFSTTASGGTWSSSNTAVATVGSATGVVSGLSNGTANISYTVGGCAATVTVTVSAGSLSVSVAPTSATVCLGGSSSFTASATTSTTTLLSQNFNSGLGSWTITNTAGVADAYWQIRSAPGYGGSAVSGDGTPFIQAAPDATSSNTTTMFKSPSFSTVGYSAATLTYNQHYKELAGADVVVAVEYSTNGGSTWSTLVDQLNTPGPTTTWSAGVPQITVGLPAAAIGQPNVMLRWNYNSNYGWYWAVDNIAVTATTSSTFAWSGVSGAGGIACSTCATTTITPTAAGTNIYSVTATQGGCSVGTTVTVNVNPAPAAIGGTATVCVGSTSTLTNTTTGGTWTSGTPSVASVASATGVVTGVVAGTAVISYTLSTGCVATRVVTVNAVPASITGSLSVCSGSTTTLANATTGGTWTLSSATVGSITSGGVFTATAAGTVTVSYTLSSGCRATAVITANTLPAVITGTTSVCAGFSSALASATTGGSWSSSNPSIASVTSTGFATGYVAGTATITYMLGTGCYRTTTFTVNPAPAAITGSGTICAGSTLTLSSATTGGTWASGNTAIATINASGVVTGVGSGSVMITYTAAGCTANTFVNVEALPGAITGSASICSGSSSSLSSTTAGGFWSSSDTSRVMINASTGVITGAAVGTATIVYTGSNGCSRSVVVTVNASPSAISGTASICAGSTTTFSNTLSGGAWSSGATSVATVNASSGVVTGVAAGTAVITYTTSCGSVTRTVTVTSTPAAIAGTRVICAGSSAVLSNATAGGVWSSSNSSVATIDSTGTYYGAAAGTATITYGFGGTCIVTATVTINPTPGEIGGATGICTGASATLTNATSGGTWSSSNTAVASITSGGVITGVSAGSVIISYTLATGCRATAAISVGTASEITGPGTVCTGSTISLSNATAGGTWSSSSGTFATVGSSSGIVSGISAGTVTITYTLSGGCRTTAVITINASPAAITGTAAVCAGSMTTLATTSTGGTWSSSNDSVAAISTSGVVTGISSGFAMITYTGTNGCFRLQQVTVNTTPSEISGESAVCAGSSTTLSNSTSGGFWSSSATAVATIGSSSGIVNGVASGVTTITYTMSGGCRATFALTVNALPAAITGTASVCIGSVTTLASATAGGLWSSGDAEVAVVDTAGRVTGLSAGFAIITYSAYPSFCYRLVQVTVNTAPASIEGPTTLCAGSSVSLVNAVSGGTWSSSSASIATVGSSTGVVTGVAAGTARITYSIGTCRATTVITVQALPAAIGGSTSVCLGTAVTLTNATSGGSWTSSNEDIFTVGTGSGIISGVSAGSATVTYTLATGCFRTATITITDGAGEIFGEAALCAGATTTFSNSVSGGTWSSSAASVASIGSSSGIVTGLAAGVATITYTTGPTCRATFSLTVNPLPAAITGTTVICNGTTTTLSSTTSGGEWSSSDGSIAAVDTAGRVTGLAPGVATITYSIYGTFCYRTANVTVNSAPATIEGTAVLCAGSTTTLSNAVSGGVWSSGAGTIASVNTATGVVTGVTAGTATISYSIGSCRTTRVVTVNALPAAITGTLKACVGSSSTLASTTTGGIWVSANDSIATADAASGVITGVSAGTTIVSYITSAGCARTGIFTVNALPADIAGSTSVCVGSTTSLTNSSTPATSWISSTTSVATITSAGVVTGVSAGTTTITYTQNTGCRTTTVVTVNAVPAAISGTLRVCLGFTTSLSNTTSVGSWSTANSAIASVDGSGIVTGVGTGTTVVSYTLATGCYKTAVVTVNALPATPTGVTTICVGSTSTLSSPGSGTWTSSNTAVATVNASRVVTGIAAGTATITFTLTSTGCISTVLVTVNALPPAISGGTSVCVANTLELTNSMSGGTWSSSNTARATVGSSSGIVTGVSAGTATITYTAATGCRVTSLITVSAFNAITGTASACLGLTTTLASTTTGGSWTSSDPSIATVGSSNGVVTGVATGTAQITYTLPSGCFRTQVVTINALPDAISGTLIVCSGSSTTLSNSTTGGTWSSSTVSVATVGSATGVVTGAAAGTARITYTAGAGCRSTAVVTVLALPGVINGTATLCAGSTTTLTNATAGGSWSSSDNSVAAVSSTGVVSGVEPGSATITYTLSTGCYRTAAVTVTEAPGEIDGILVFCAGTSQTLSNSVSGGVWTSSNTAIATIGSSTGVVTGVASGTARITYTVGTCRSVSIATVNPLPAAITGTPETCYGSGTTLSSATSGGSWFSSNPAVASVDMASGYVSGMAEGTVTISYMLPTGCASTVSFTVNPWPGAVAGAANVCVGGTTGLGHSISGGTWSSSNTSVISVGLTSGIVTGISAGTGQITYTTPIGCQVVTGALVRPNPAAITGTMTIYPGSSTTLSSTTTGGSWSSASSNVSVGSSTGVVTGVSVGTAVVSYTVDGCSATAVVTVSGTASITGTLTVCEGANTTLSNAIGGGTWTSATPSVATVAPASGVVTGVSAGTAVISYSLSGSTTTAIVTVLATPAVTGSVAACEGFTTTLSGSPAGGTWISGSTSVATVGSTSGIVTGVSEGSASVTYTLGTGCSTSYDVYISAQPAAITGTTTVTVGSETTLASTTAGGSWTSSNTTVATVNLGSGVVTGEAAGTAVITYMTASGCYVTAVVTVEAATPDITGTGIVCVGATTTLSNALAGGSWSSSNTAVATVSAGGVVTGVAAGTAEITYMMPSSSYVTMIVTVNAVPGAITGSLSVCEGVTTALSSTTSGGTWSSSNTAVATVDASGLVSGISAGTVNISYTLATGCYVTEVVTVKAAAPVLSGATSLCVGRTTTITATGGTWSSSDAGIATVSATGVVTGVASGSVTITFTRTNGCFSTLVINVSDALDPISGPLSVCLGDGATLSHTTTGGTWTSSNTSVVTIDAAAGTYTSVASGVATVSYTVASGCSVSATITVNVLPAALTGSAVLCAGSTTTLSSITAGGTWSTGDAAVATVGATGVVSGVAGGTAYISYTSAAGCSRTVLVTVNALPDAITGSGTLCIGGSSTFSSTSTGGTWSSSAGTIVSVGSASGVVTGVAAGTAPVTYTLPTGCRAITVVTVTTGPAVITGTMKACPGTTTTLSSATSGGSWSSSDASVATVGSSDGIVTGVVPGIVTITYSVGAGCQRTTTVTINANPGAITGTAVVCIGQFTNLSSTPAGGTWASSATGIATVSSSGAVTGVAAGTATITYTAGGCYSTIVATVSAPPTASTGTLSTCVGNSTTLSNAVPGGTWSSASPAIATVNVSTGVVTGVASGTSRITYSVGSGCYTVATVSVLPAAGAITGSLVTCVGFTTTLSGASGVWTSSNTAIATVGSSNRVVTGIAPGTATITFTNASGCFSTAVVTVNAVPVISGTTNICAGNASTLSSTVPGGTWASPNVAVATVGSASGVVTGVGGGTINISYTIGTGCRVLTPFTVRALPAAFTGASSVCVGSTSTMLNTTTGGGTWTSANTAIATIGTGSSSGIGLLSGVSVGTVDITFTSTNTGCARSKNVTVNATPSAGTISGPATVIVSSTITLSSTVAGGTWSSGSTGVATVGAATGIVTGVSAGAANITYTANNGCGVATAVHTVNVTTSRPGGPAQEITSAEAVSTEASIFPNPTNGVFSVKTSEGGMFTIFSVDGKEITRFMVNSGVSELSMPNGVAAGVYMCRFTGNSGGAVVIRLIYKQ